VTSSTLGTVVTAMLCLTSRLAFSGQVTGRVVDEQGAPIPGASVWSEAGEAKADAAGQFVLPVDKLYSEGTRVVRVSAPGRRPLTRMGASRVAQPFVLRGDPAATWSLPRCTGAVFRVAPKGFIQGLALRLRIPDNMEVKAPVDIETVRRQVCRGPDCLTHTWGGMYDSGAERIASLALKGAKDVGERDVRNPVSDVDGGVEYRGTRNDGTHMRFVSVPSEWIAYEGVSASSAALFDRIIDTMCALPRRW
jgi:hypothetical protein